MHSKEIYYFYRFFEDLGHKGTPPKMPRAMGVSAQRSFQSKRDSVPRLARVERDRFSITRSQSTFYAYPSLDLM